MDKNIHVQSAKYIQNVLTEQGCTCYLIGGSLISALRDNGVQKNSDDIDFAVLSDNSDYLNTILSILDKNLYKFSWQLHGGCLSIFINTDINYKIDLFLFKRFYLNYLMLDLNWMHEKIYTFQTFKPETVFLENTSFITMYRPDLFLKTVYGDWHTPRSGYNPNFGGDTSHMRTCVFYTSSDNYDNVDLQVNFLNNFFKNVIVKRNFDKYDKKEINVIDDCIKNVNYENSVVYSKFTEFVIKNSISF